MHPHRKATLIARLPIALKGNIAYKSCHVKDELNAALNNATDPKIIVCPLKSSQQNTNSLSKADNPTPSLTHVQILSTSESTKTCKTAPRCISLGESTIQKTRFKPKKDVKLVDKYNSMTSRVLRSRTKAMGKLMNKTINTESN